MANTNTTYRAYPTLQRFHNDYEKYKKRFVAGPPGSGKSVANAIELISIGLRQEPTPDDPITKQRGVRYTKFGIIRSTYGELERTTLETLKAWLPSKYTKINHSKPIRVRTKWPLPDGTVADMQFELIAIESVHDLGKLDSYEATAIWLNEMTGVPMELVGKAGERSGRYPPPNLWDDGKNHCTYYGVIGDYNYPPKDHWLVGYLHEGEMPEETMLYEQPPALYEDVDVETGATSYRLNPVAENLIHLDNGTKYLDDLATYLRLGLMDMIQTRLLCRYGRAGGGGKKVFTSYDAEYHVSAEPLKPLKLTDTMISIDTSGIHPCATFWQFTRGEWFIIDGLYGEEMGFEEFVDDVMTPTVLLRYPGCSIICVCDPANARDSRTATTPVDLLIDRDYVAITADTNNFKARLQASETILNRRGSGRVTISCHLTLLIDAMDGGYQYKKLQVVGSETIFSSNPIKNKYAHWADSFQYGSLYIVTTTMSKQDSDLIKKVAKASYRRSKR